MLDRRGVVASGMGLAAASALPAGAATVTVNDVLARMRGRIGTEWREGGVDRIVAGSGDTVVTGIATTMMGTFDALKGAVARKANLVITHEPTWWSHPDLLDGLADDPLYKVKSAYAREHNLVSFHFHDHWHQKKPVDGIHVGMAQRMGWLKYRDPAERPYGFQPSFFNLPPTTLAKLADELRAKLGARTLRVVGDPALPAAKVMAWWGYNGGLDFLDSEADVLVIGEAQDWDVIAYAKDQVTSGRRKGLIVLGHIVSEQWGMKYCADWLKTFVPEVPVSFVQLAEPYWNLKNPVRDMVR